MFPVFQANNRRKKEIIINLTKNFGHQEAIFAGLESIESDFYGVMDSDLQHDPILFVTMLDRIINNNCEVVQMQKINKINHMISLNKI